MYFIIIKICNCKLLSIQTIFNWVLGFLQVECYIMDWYFLVAYFNAIIKLPLFL